MPDNSHKSLLAVAIMVKNEQDRLIRTLNSIISHVEYVVIQDTGSTDQTIAQVREFCQAQQKPLELSQESWVDFSHNRNLLLRAAQGKSKYILVLDANDEIQSPQTLVHYLKQKRIQMNPRLATFRCRHEWVNIQGEPGNNSTYYRVNLIRSGIPEIHYEYPVHEYLTISGTGWIMDTELENTEFAIYQDRLQDKSSKPRFEWDIKILLQHIQENGEEERNLRYLCQSLDNLHRYPELLHYATRLIELPGKVDSVASTREAEYSEDRYKGYLWKARCESILNYSNFNKSYLRAYAYLNEHNLPSAEPLYELAVSLKKQRAYREALIYIKKACELPIPQEKEVRTVVNLDLYHKMRWILLREILEYLQAEDQGSTSSTVSPETYQRLMQKVERQLQKQGLKTVAVSELSETQKEDLRKRVQDGRISLAEMRRLGLINTNLPSQTELLQRSQGSELWVLVTYRDRQEQLQVFIPYMQKYLNFHQIKHRIVVLEQKDTQLFNRGMLYNLGVKWVQDYLGKNPDTSSFAGNQKHIYFAFHDVDILPVQGTNYYLPEPQTINHLYGGTFSLGGIFLMRLQDYQRIKGFSNKYWGWGFEDNDLLRRVEDSGFTVDRSFMSERYQGEVFRELDSQTPEDFQKKMIRPETQRNQGLFNMGTDPNSDGVETVNLNCITAQNVAGVWWLHCWLPDQELSDVKYLKQDTNISQNKTSTNTVHSQISPLPKISLDKYQQEIISRNHDPLDPKKKQILILGNFATFNMNRGLSNNRIKFLHYLALHPPKGTQIRIQSISEQDFLSVRDLQLKPILQRFQPDIILYYLMGILDLQLGNPFKDWSSALQTYPNMSRAIWIEDIQYLTNYTNFIQEHQFTNVILGTRNSGLYRAYQQRFPGRKIFWMEQYLDRDVFRDWEQEKKWDILLYGCCDPSVYPLRTRLHQILQHLSSDSGLKIKIIDHPGYNNSKAAGTSTTSELVVNQELSRLINQSYLTVCTKSRANLLLKKYIETGLSGSVILGDFPSGYPRLSQELCMVRVSQEMTDSQILSTILESLQNREELKVMAQRNLSLFSRFSYQNGGQRVGDILETILYEKYEESVSVPKTLFHNQQSSIRVSFYTGDMSSTIYQNILSLYWELIPDSTSPDLIIYNELFQHTVPDFRNQPFRIAIAGEPVTVNHTRADLSLAFDLDHPKAYYYPFGIRSLDWFRPEQHNYYQRLLRTPKKLQELPNIISKKTYFCGFVSRREIPFRMQFVQLLSQSYKGVTCPGSVLNNHTAIGGNWNGPEKLEFLRKCKFTIAFENTDNPPGYLTEKIFHPFLAQSIPIYWGSTQVKKYLNPKAFLDYKDFATPEALVQEIQRLDQDPEAYEAMLREPVFKENTIPPEWLPENMVKEIQRRYDEWTQGRCTGSNSV